MEPQSVTQPEQPPTGSERASASHPEAAERIAMFERLISGMGFGCNGDPDLTLESYIGGTSDVPLPWLREGLRAFVSQPDRQWVPTLPEVRTACALAIRRHRDNARGEDAHSGVGQVELGAWHVERAIAFAAESVPLGVGQLHALFEGERKQRRLGAGNRPEPTSQAEALDPRHVTCGGDIAQSALEIAKQGRYVPGWRTGGDALNGRLLALMLANLLAGQDAMWPEYDAPTHRRVAAAMERHRANGGEREWWDDHCGPWARRVGAS